MRDLDRKPLAEVDVRQKDVELQTEASSYLDNELEDFLRLVEECEKLHEEELDLRPRSTA